HGLDKVIDRAGGDTLNVGFLDDQGQCLFGHPARLKEGGKVAALTQFRDAKLDGSAPGLPAAVPVAVAMIEPIRCPGTGLSPGQGLNLQRHQPLSGEADHLTQKVGIAGLFQQGLEVHGLGGHRWVLGLGSVVVTKPYRRSAMTTAVDKMARRLTLDGRYRGPLIHRSYTTPWGTTDRAVRDGFDDAAGHRMSRQFALAPMTDRDLQRLRILTGHGHD